jgi:hypothetical protein
MFDSLLNFEGDTILVNGVAVDATCGPERIGPLSDFDTAMVIRRKIVGNASELPHVERQVATIDGVEWQVETSSIVGDVTVVTFMRYAG